MSGRRNGVSADAVQKRNALIVSLAEQGIARSEIAAGIGLDSSTVGKIIARHNADTVRHPPFRWTPEADAKLRQWDDWSIADQARELGCPKESVQRRRATLGIKINWGHGLAPDAVPVAGNNDAVRMANADGCDRLLAAIGKYHPGSIRAAYLDGRLTDDVARRFGLAA